MDVTNVEFCCEKKGSRALKKSKISDEQIIGILREAEGDMAVPAVCARHNIRALTEMMVRRAAWMFVGPCG